jgi:hypothetical protein
MLRLQLVLSLFLIGLSVVLVAAHMRSSRHDAGSDPCEAGFHRRQYRRRMLASSLIGAVGLALLAGIRLEETLLAAAYWMVIMAVVVWIAALALIDLACSRAYFDQLRAEQLRQQDAFLSDIERLRNVSE